MIHPRILAVATTLALTSGPAHAQQPAADYRARLPQDEVIYLIMPDRFDNADLANDRGGLRGDRLKTGYDPTGKGFYHGGDLKGVLRRLNYIQGLGTTALWLTPVFVNKAVQGPPGHESAGYHGYWITDFTRVDPHLGTNADFKALVDAAHARGMKFYMDIVVNHTADVIQFRECVGKPDCPYRSIADYPYQRRGGVHGAAINRGFGGEADGSAGSFARLTDPDYAYSVEVPPAERNVKVPAWLNDPIYYHNRGDSIFRGESSQMGDFFGLDDVFTENPRVVAGMIQIYGDWIARYHVDGFRIDTERHVNAEFWRQFVPAMLERARQAGIPNFHIFGEVMDPDPAGTAEHTRDDGLPAVMDYPFASAVADTVTGRKGTDALAQMFRADTLYEGGSTAALGNVTFSGNYDVGRIGFFLRDALPTASADELLKRDLLAHAMVLTLRGVPAIYYGDEQGMTGKGGDQAARQDLFASKVASYNDDPLIGASGSTATARFARDNPIYRQIATLAHIRTAHPALTRGLQVTRYSSDKPGLFAASRFDPASGREMLLLFNSSSAAIHQNVRVETRSAAFEALAGTCPVRAVAPGSVAIDLPPLGFAVCNAR